MAHRKRPGPAGPQPRSAADLLASDEPVTLKPGVPFKKLNGTDIAVSCVSFQEAVKRGNIIHVGQPALDMAISGARTRRVGDTQTWDRGFSGDISALVACAAAAYRLGVLASAPYDLLQSVR